MITPRYAGFVLTLLTIALCSSLFAVAQCRQIEAEAKVVASAAGKRTPTLVIEYKDGINPKKFYVNLFGPDRQNQLNSEKTSFDELPPGKYLVVIVARSEADNYCPKSLEITVTE